MRGYNLHLPFLMFFLSDTAYGLQILGIFPHLGASHFRFFHPIMKRLAEIGHQVTVISHFPESNPHINYRDLSLDGGEELSINLEVNDDDWKMYHNWIIR